MVAHPAGQGARRHTFMTNPRLARSLDALADWRRSLDRRVDQFAGLLNQHDLIDADGTTAALLLKQRLASDRLVLAFVAEFSRGKSELINAIFFADAGRRILPATPGRTTMCPVEMAWEPQEPPSLALLPIESRRSGQPVSQLRVHLSMWRRSNLPLGDPAQLAKTLAEVTRVIRVPVDQARELGFWSDEEPEDNPLLGADNLVEVPAWRHALINYPHPLLRRGLVVIDTPGLNAIGAEPELTLNLLPSAHATVFVLAADTGVTRSDLSVWRDHLGDTALERFVVLNKVDTLADPLLSNDEVQRLIASQCDDAARILQVQRHRVFPLSARLALNARLTGDKAALEGSGLLALEQALTGQLLPSRAAVVGRMVEQGVQGLRQRAQHLLADRRRQNAEQMTEMRGLRGKSQIKVDMLSTRMEQEAAEFEACLPRLGALRSVQARHLRDTLLPLSPGAVRTAVEIMQQACEASLLRLGSGRAFETLTTKLRQELERAAAAAVEIEQMVKASFRQLNSDFGFALLSSPAPSLQRHLHEMALIAASYGRYFGLRSAWRLSEPGFMAQFMRMLQSKLVALMEGASAEIETWSRGASTQLDAQLRDRRRGFEQRREAFQRVSAAAGELERRIAEVETHDQRLCQWAERIDALAVEIAQAARQFPLDSLSDKPPQLQLVRGDLELDLPQAGLAGGGA